MSWFAYSDLKSKKEKNGVWLRINRGSNAELINELRKIGKLNFNDHISKIEINEPNDNDQTVLLEVWSEKIFTMEKLRFIITGNFPMFPEKYTVFYYRIKENPDWICEGDLGKGYPKK